jgi:hypothetical protein
MKEDSITSEDIDTKYEEWASSFIHDDDIEDLHPMDIFYAGYYAGSLAQSASD